MRCDLHVHTIHSGMCTIPVARRFCRESYTDADAVYERLKRLGMDLVTVTDHDSIDAGESLRRRTRFPAPLLIAVPLVTLVNCWWEGVFAWRWNRKLRAAWGIPSRNPLGTFGKAPGTVSG
jgi:hypothetical protein